MGEVQEQKDTQDKKTEKKKVYGISINCFVMILGTVGFRMVRRVAEKASLSEQAEPVAE